jgi:hypothetical protein
MSVMGAETGAVFPYPVGNGKPSTFHNDHDTDMDDPFTTPQLGHGHGHRHQRHRIDSQGVPIPPARTTSLDQTHSSFSSTTSLPSVQVTNATPTKQRIKDVQDHVDHHHHQHHSHPYQQGGYAYSSSFGSGSLDITDGYTGQHEVGFGAGFTPQVPYHYSSSTDQLTTSYTSMEEESDSELQIQDEERKRKEEEEAKKERQKRMGRDRQRKKRQKDRAELEVSYMFGRIFRIYG